MFNQSYQKIIDRLGFVEQTTFKKDFKKGKFIVQGTAGGKSILLKIIPKASGQYANFFREELASQLLDESLKKVEGFVVPKIIAMGEQDDLAWLSREYQDGTSLAKMNHHLSLFGYDIIEKQFISQKSYVLPSIINALKRFKEIKQFSNSNELTSYYPGLLNEDRKKIIEDELKINLESQSNFFDSIRKDYFDDSNFCVTHGDLTLGNIILTPDKQVNFVDFEKFCLDNYMTDVAYLWLFLWRYKDWQEDLLKSMIKSEQDQIFFRAGIIRILFLLYAWPYDSISDSLISKKKFLSNHIWTRYLIAAGLSYKALIEVE